MMKLKIIQCAVLTLLLLVAGLFWGTWFSLSRSIDQFSAAEFIHIGKTIIVNVAFPMRIILPSCILLMCLCVWLYPQKRSPGFYYSLSALAFIIITLLITLLVEVPIDNQINTWTPATVPSDWEGIRAKWQLFHTIRTYTSMASFISFSIAAVFYPQPGQIP